MKLPAIFSNKLTILSFLFLLFWMCYFLYFWSNAIFFDERGNMMVTHVSIWGDWAAHFTMGSAMAYRSLLLETSPFLIGAPFSYPFAANLFSAFLITQGASFFSAFVIPSAVASIALIFMLFIFYRLIFKSEVVAIMASSIYLCNGGLGFLQYISDVLAAPHPFKALLNPEQEYTHLSNWSIEWISIINSMIIPQRAFTLGFPIALCILLLLYTVFFSKRTNKKHPYLFLVLAGVLTGALPMIHSHSFLALGIIIPCWGLASIIKSSSRKQHIHFWLIWLIATACIALPLINIFLSKNIENDFFSWFPGWFAKEHDVNWLIFWFNNWGIVPILSLIGYAALIKSGKSVEDRLKIALLFIPFFIIFILLNLFLFQPFIWDNTKLLAWASVGISGLAAYSLVYIWQKMHKKHILQKSGIAILVIFIFFTSIASGAIDAFRIIRFDLHTYQMYSKEELQLTEWVKTNTDKNSIWLTGDQHNTWLFNLTGRQSLLTFRGWLWTHGYDYLETEQDTATLFLNPTDDLIKKYNISYALIGYNEKDVWHANEQLFINRFPIVIETPDYVIFDLRQRIN